MDSKEEGEKNIFATALSTLWLPLRLLIFTEARKWQVLFSLIIILFRRLLLPRLFLSFLLRTANILATIFIHLNFTNNQVFRLEKTNSEKRASK